MKKYAKEGEIIFSKVFKIPKTVQVSPRRNKEIRKEFHLEAKTVANVEQYEKKETLQQLKEDKEDESSINEIKTCLICYDN